MTSEFPLLIPSYNRQGAPLIRLATKVLKDDYPWFVMVRKSQKQDYLDAGLPRSHALAAADSTINSVGKAHTKLMKWAIRQGFHYAFDWDDDIMRFGRKLPDGTRHESYKSTGNTDPWFDGPAYWKSASKLATRAFKRHPLTVAGSIQNQRWASSLTLQVQCGKTPRRSKIMNLDRISEHGLWCPKEFWKHGDDIGCAALYLQRGFQVFTIGNLVYDFAPETSIACPSTLRDRDESKNREIHTEELHNLNQYDITNYLRVTKRYEDGTYMYGDINWQRYRKLTGSKSYTYDYTDIRRDVPLSKIPVTVK